jgi:hypothetical protein
MGTPTSGRTLVTSVTVATRTETKVLDDVPAVINKDGFYTRLSFVRSDEKTAVVIRLTGAERVALIEALGGTDL